MRMRQVFVVAAAAAVAGCAHGAPAAQGSGTTPYAVEVRNTTGVDLRLGFCGQRDCEDLGSLPAGETRRFDIAAPDGPGITLFGKEGDRWVARTRVELLDAQATRVSLTPITP